MALGRGGSGIKYRGLVGGKKQWQARLYWIDDKTGATREARRVFFAESKTLAMQRRDEELEKAKLGLDTPGRIRFRDVGAEWLATLPVVASRLTHTSRIKTLNLVFGDWYLDTVTRRHMQDYLDGLDVIPDNLRYALISMFKYAVRRGYVEANIAKLTELPPRVAAVLEDAPEKALTPAQVVRYFEDLKKHEPDLYPIVVVQFVLGCRFAEVTALRLEDVNLETGMVKIRRGQYRGEEGGTKGKYARPAGLPSFAVELLKVHLKRMKVEQWPGWRELVFPRPAFSRVHNRFSNYWASSTVDTKIRKAYARLGFPLAGSTSHVARHTMITVANTLTAAPSQLLKEVVGHKGDRVHQVYNHTPDAAVLALGESVGRALTAAGTGTKTGTAPTKKQGKARKTRAK